jgi:hypothetical protein
VGPGSSPDTITGLTNGDTYTFGIKATSSNGQSAEVYSATVVPDPPTPPTPTGLVASAVTTSGATLNWNASSGATGYRLYANTSSHGLELVGTTTTNSATTATDTGDETSGTAVAYTVSAYSYGGPSGAGESAQSPAVNITTLDNAPTALSATASSDTAVSLAWTAPSGTVSSYTVYESGTALSLGVTFSGTTASVTGLSGDTSYTFKVAAVDAGGTSVQSSSASATTPYGTATTLSSSDSGSGYAPDSPVITATVSSASGTNAGTVNFTVNGTTASGCGAKAVTSSSPATCTLSSLAAGTYSVVGVFTPTNPAVYATSTSAPLTETATVPYAYVAKVQHGECHQHGYQCSG